MYKHYSEYISFIEYVIFLIANINTIAYLAPIAASVTSIQLPRFCCDPHFLRLVYHSLLMQPSFFDYCLVDGATRGRLVTFLTILRISLPIASQR